MGSRRKSMKRSKNLERGEGSRSKVIPWDELPFDILENIMTMVYHGDQVNIRRVCKNWNVKGEVPPLKQLPWLIDFTDNNSWGSFKMVNPYDNHKIYDVNVRDRRLCGKSLEDVHVHECKKGWFLMSKAKHFKTNDTSLFLFSPFFKCEIIELPDLRFPFTLVSFSSNPRDENCAYFALHVSHRIPTSVVIGTCTKKDRMWSRLSFECDSHMSYDFRSVVYIEQECSFYCLAQNGSIGIYNIAEQSWRVEQYEVKLISPRGVHDHPRLIQSQGHVLMVDIVPKSTDCSTWNVPNYAIYSLDKQTSKWKRLDEMKSEVFFLGGCSAAIPATWGSNTSIPTTSGGNRVFYSSGTKIKQFVFSDTRRYCDTRSHPCQVYYGPSVVKLGETGRMTFIEAPQ